MASSTATLSVSPSPIVEREDTPSPEEAYAVYEARATNGVFDTIAEGFQTMGPRALANAEVDVDFQRQIQGWSNNYSYIDCRSGKEWGPVVFGEIMPKSAGTILNAKGNHYPGRQGCEFEPLGDGSKSKDVFVIGRPTFATQIIEDLYMNQLGSLNEIREGEEAEERANKWAGVAKEWIRNKKGNNTDIKDLITLHMGPKYGVRHLNPGGGEGGKNTRIKKRALTVADETADATPTANGDASGVAVTAGAWYDPSVLPDYGGPYFNLVTNKLKQQDIRDPDDQLIAPWDAYSALRPGTLIMAECTLHAFLLRDGSGERRIYQINAESIRVLDYSKEPLVIPVRPSVPSLVGTSSASSSGSSLGSTRRARSEAFANFKVIKRARLRSPSPKSGDSLEATAADQLPVAETATVAKDRSPVKGKGKAASSRGTKKLAAVLSDADAMVTV
ncbi:hypothetical protein FPV67DRAFT_1426587 [Lyophyllum atratum]|nr:hypothetical protein FPV67DRAFT_1426587 [Lyophyllum atratum]